MWKIVATKITQQFNQRTIFKDISFELKSGESIVFVGPNGSGKTTLIRIICQLIRPRGGEVTFYRGDSEIPQDQLYPYLGLVGPYLQLYNNLTALENYRFFAKIRGLEIEISQFKNLMETFGLRGREMDELSSYSSGMLQRVKYVMALIHQPPILILDEPTSNLDDKGTQVVYELMQTQKKDKILIIATNEPEEFRFGEKQIQLVS